MLADTEHVDRSKVSFDHFDRAHVKAWLAWLADDKHYSARTITLQLSAIKTFLAYAAAEDVTLVALSQAAKALKPPAAPKKPIEETGLRVVDLDLLHGGPILPLTDHRGGEWQVHTFLASTMRSPLRLNWEHDTYRWVTPRQIPRFDCQVAWLPDVLQALALR